jgi:integrase
VVNQKDRCKYKFISRNVLIIDEEGTPTTYPCIVLYDIETKIPVKYTGYERYIKSLVDNKMLSGKTRYKASINICVFLNYLLYETTINSIHECTLDIIRQFLLSSKTKGNGDNYTRDSWTRRNGNIYCFLRKYYIENKDILSFSYDGEQLQKLTIVRDKEHHKKVILVDNAHLNIKPPRVTHRKNRVLVHGYLNLFLYEVKKYDPMIAIAVALQAYAGLREGEIVNLAIGNIEFHRRQFSTLSSIEINISERAEFLLRDGRKTNSGEIKKPRFQRVYDDFLHQINTMYTEHLRWLELKGYSTENNAPLFIDTYGRPMSVQTYSNRVKKIFYDHFLPSLKLTCQKNNSLADNIAFIEAYEQEYPGAHMFRHWFTMYLLTKAKLTSGEIMKWRGDEKPESMSAYIHENEDLLRLYRDSSYTFQASLLEDIYD